MENWIITGTSRGLGAALARLALRADRRLVCIARGGNEELVQAARQGPCYLEYLCHDLSDASSTAVLADRIFNDLPRDATRWVLINNAGTVAPVGREPLDAHSLQAALNVNLSAAMIIGSRFVTATDGTQTDRRVLNISSGAGRGPMSGWSAYCASKAALDMYTRCLNAEAAGTPHPVRAVSIAPGVIDTEMQAVIRSTTAEVFPQVERFRALKEQGQLQHAVATAERLLQYLDRADFGTREIDDLRNY